MALGKRLEDMVRIFLCSKNVKDLSVHKVAG